jgi:predicted TIM-barrel fold metal-dependent hydrolase
MKADVIDVHFHVGLLGDRFSQWGSLSAWYRKQLQFKAFLLYTRVRQDELCDERMMEETLKTIESSRMDGVVCLALDPLYDDEGHRREDLSHMWVDNEYVLHLQRELPDRVLLGASVHPYDPDFEDRVKVYVDKGAVLLKWLPSAQGINLADERTRDAMVKLATIGPDGRPLPLLLHTGPEYAIPPWNIRVKPYDFLSWGRLDRFRNLFHRRRWFKPDAKAVNANLRHALDQGMTVIFAHCGLSYFFPYGLLGRIFEHSDFKSVRDYLNAYPATSAPGGRCFADCSAFATPFRQTQFEEISKLPQESLLFGSDFPTPVFELSAGLEEAWRDFKAVLKGDFERIIVPQDNLLDVNYRELSIAFPNHKMFTNFKRHLLPGDMPASDTHDFSSG